MKIAIFRDGPLIPATTGGAYVINNFLDFLSAKGHEVYLFRCYRGWEDWREYKIKNYCTILLKPEDYYDNLYISAKIINQFGINIVQFDSPESVCLQGEYLKRKTLAKIVYEAHNIDSVLFKRLGSSPKLIKKTIDLENQTVKIADLVLVRSEFDRDSLLRIGADKEKIKICPTAVNPAAINYVEDRANNQKVIFLGNLDYKPNETAVSIILKEIMQKTIELNPHIKFCIAGKGGKRLSVKYKHYRNSNLEFTDTVDNINHFFSQASVALCPLIEGSGTRLKILDYLAAGIPVISTHLGIEGLEDEIKNCLIVEDDFQKYPEIICMLLKKENKTLSRKGLRFIKKYRSWDRNINYFIESYQKIK